MSPLLLIVVVLLVLLVVGGGWGYRSYGTAYPYYGPGIGLIGIILIVLIVLMFTGRL